MQIAFVDGHSMGGFGYANVSALPGRQVSGLLWHEPSVAQNFLTLPPRPRVLLLFIFEKKVIQQLRAPTIPGVYSGTWRLVCSAGYFGDPLWVFMTVDAVPEMTEDQSMLKSFNDVKLTENATSFHFQHDDGDDMEL